MDLYRIEPDRRVDLSLINTSERIAFGGIQKALSVPLLQEMNRELSELQRLLWADGRHALLIVLQAMDTGG